MTNKTDPKEIERIEQIVLKELARFPERGRPADVLLNATIQLYHAESKIPMYAGNYNLVLAGLESSGRISSHEGTYRINNP